MKEKFIEKRRIEQGREKKRIIGRKEEEGKNNEVKNSKVTKRGKRKIRKFEKAGKIKERKRGKLKEKFKRTERGKEKKRIIGE